MGERKSFLNQKKYCRKDGQKRLTWQCKLEDKKMDCTLEFRRRDKEKKNKVPETQNPLLVLKRVNNRELWVWGESGAVKQPFGVA